MIRWIAAGLASPKFWSIRRDWADLHQEVLTRVIESLRKERFDPSRDFRSYVQGITRFTALQEVTRKIQSASRPYPADAGPGRPANPEKKILDRHLARRVLDLASTECRELMRAYFFEGRTYAEIAATLACPVGTVKSRLFRCLEGLHRTVREPAGAGSPAAPGKNTGKT